MAINERKTEDDFDPNELAKELGLTDKQQKFADAYVFVTQLDAEKALEVAEYKIGTDQRYSADKYPDPALAKYYKDLEKQRLARQLLNHPDILRYIKAVRDNMDKQLIVDKLWVVKKLKTLADTGSERTQLEATKLLGQTFQMFTEVQKIDVADDPAAIARDAFKKRKEEEARRASEKDNVVDFRTKEEMNGN